MNFILNSKTFYIELCMTWLTDGSVYSLLSAIHIGA